MSEWINATVGEVTQYQKAGGTPSATEPSFYDGDIPFVVIEDITSSSRFLEGTRKTLSNKGLSNSAAWFIKDPHVLYSMYATVGKPIINRISCATNQAIIALKENDLIEQDFLYYHLLLIRPLVYKFTAQTTQSNLNAAVVKRLPISYPKDKAYQRKISRILISVDRAIASTEALIEKYQHIKTGLMHDLFTRGIGADGKLRPPREQAPELYKDSKDSAIGWIPKEWNFINLGTHTDSWAMGPRFSADEYSENGNVATLRTTDISVEGFIEYPTMPIAKLQLDGLKSHLLKKDDFVITRSGTCGICAVFDDFRIPVLPGAFLIRFRFLKTLSPHYAAIYFNSEAGRPIVSRVAEGGVQKNLRGTSLYAIRLPIPNRSEQERILKLIKSASIRIDIERKKRIKLQKQKSGLMHDLLTGQVPVTPTAISNN